MVIWQKGESQKEVTRIQSTPNFPKKEHFLPPDTHTYVCVSGCKKCSFFGTLGMLCILVTSVLRFAFLPYYRRSYILLLFFENIWKYLNIYFLWTWFKACANKNNFPEWKNVSIVGKWAIVGTKNWPSCCLH